MAASLSTVTWLDMATSPPHNQSGAFSQSWNQSYSQSWNQSYSQPINTSDAGAPSGGRGGVRVPSPDIQRLMLWDSRLDHVMPVTLSLGIVANLLAVLTFMTSPLKVNSLSHYLSALAIADVMNLMAGLVLWLSNHGFELYSRVGVCQLTSFVLLMSRFLSVWYLLSSHVERLLCHVRGASSKRWCSVFRTKCVILVIFVLSLVAFLHYIWSHVVTEDPIRRGHYVCTTMPESVQHINRLRRVELVLALFLPMLLMLLIDTALLIKMLARRRTNIGKTRSSDRTLTSLKAKGDPSLRSTTKDYASADNGEITALSKAGTREEGAGVVETENGNAGNNSNDSQPVTTDLSQEKCCATAMCILLGLVFIALTLPSAYLRARINFAEQRGRFPLTEYELHLIRVLEKVIHFTGLYKVLLYLLFLPSFRRALLSLLTTVFCSRCLQHRHAITVV